MAPNPAHLPILCSPYIITMPSAQQQPTPSTPATTPDQGYRYAADLRSLMPMVRIIFAYPILSELTRTLGARDDGLVY